MATAVLPTTTDRTDTDNSTTDVDATVSVAVPEVALLVFTRLLQGDRRMLEHIGLTDTDLHRLKTLPSETLPRLLERASGGSVVQVRFDRQALSRLLRHLRTDSRTETEIRSMIDAEASHPFMKHFYGMPYAIYHQYRQQAGLLRAAGRPTTPPKAVCNVVTDLLRKLDLLGNDTAIGPFDLLAIHQLTGHTLRDIWSVYLRVSGQSSADRLCR